MKFSFTVDTLPEGYQAGPAAFAQWMAEHLHAEAEGDLPVGVVGTVRPTEDSGVFFNLADKSVEFWDDNKGRYVPASDVPIGTVYPVAQKARGAEPPPFYLYCDGSEVLKTDFPDLYEEIGDLWGDASDADHFRLPDIRGRIVVGEGIGAYDPVATQAEAQVGKKMQERAIGEYFGLESVKARPKPANGPTTLEKLDDLKATGSTITSCMQPSVAMLYIIRAK